MVILSQIFFGVIYFGCLLLGIHQKTTVALRYFFMRYLLVLIFLLGVQTAVGQINRTQLLDSAKVYFEKGLYASAQPFLEKAFEISSEEADTVKMAEDLMFIGENQSRSSNLKKALDAYLKSIRLVDFRKDTDSLKFRGLLKIARCFSDLSNEDKSDEYLEQAKIIAGKSGNDNLKVILYTSLGVSERRKENYEPSIAYYKKAIELIQATDSVRLIETYVNLSTAYGYNEQYEEAIAILEQAQILNSGLKNDYFKILLLAQIARNEFLRGNSEIAAKYYLEGLEFAELNEDHDLIKRFNRALARLYSKEGDYKEAYKYYAQFVIELESSINNQNATAIAEMTAKYETEKKEQEVLFEKRQRKLESIVYEQKIEQQRLVTFLLIFAALILVLAFVWNIRVQKKRREVLRELAEKQIAITKQDAELNAQKEERNRLSRELHDGLGGTLASIKMRLSNQLNENENQELKVVLNDLDNACQEVRNVSHSLNSFYISNIDFFSLLTNLIGDIKMSTGLEMNLDFLPKEELNQLSEELKHHCYRIIQELSNNTIKHAQATSLLLGLILDEKDVILMVEDNGIGFDPENIQSDGIGWKNIKSRVEKIKGELTVDSVINRGTTVSIRFPFQ
ncbi:tetratricopeptide repeat protein [Cryomorpha ignava]|uniref:Tetratricopeptide repeat protein n=1 Tax=Cryomorpha ignava TaxID=101383 RepID=A0A7K3WSI6_9FLAO|nr:tetratricopeptide repeat protein [Cryomorpha ignava]NEN23842.1 tetratricopeptide repeat protein [Cryomorpha ignava]